jgi:hypothetical protein
MRWEKAEKEGVRGELANFEDEWAGPVFGMGRDEQGTQVVGNH